MITLPLSCVSDGDVGQGLSGQVDGHWIFVTVYGALARNVGGMPDSDLENDHLVVLPASINAFAFNGDNGVGGGSGSGPGQRLRRRQGLPRRAGGLR